MRKRLFNPGDLLQTKGLNSLIADNPERYNEVRNAYFRYIAGDWGNTCEVGIETLCRSYKNIVFRNSDILSIS